MRQYKALDWVLTPFIWMFIIFGTLLETPLLIMADIFLPNPIRLRAIHFITNYIWSTTILYGSLLRVRTFYHQRNLPHPRIFLSNHLSMVDIPVLMRSLPRGFRFISKKENFNIPVLGYCMRSAEFVAIDRGSRREAIRTINAAAETIHDQNVSVWMAPEGTRSKDGELASFKKGPFIMALKSKVPIVPVWLRGIDQIHQSHSLMFGARVKVDVVVGRDYTRHLEEEMTADQLSKEIRNEVIKLKEGFEELETQGLPPYPAWGFAYHHFEGLLEDRTLVRPVATSTQDS